MFREKINTMKEERKDLYIKAIISLSSGGKRGDLCNKTGI